MPITIYMPKLSPTMTEGVVAKWHKKAGDRVEVGDVLLEISTDKATLEHAALDEGFLRQIVAEEGQKVEVNSPLAVMTETKDESIAGFVAKPLGGEVSAPKIETAAPKAAPQAHVQVKSEGRTLASPLAKKLAKERGLNLSTIKGTGPNARVMSRDLVDAKANASQDASKSTPQATAHTTHRTLPASGKIVEEPLSPMRQVIAKRLQESKSTIPHFYVHQDVDAAPISALREELKKLDKNVTINDFIVKACAIALKHHPEINSGFDSQKFQALRFPSVDICVAVTVPGGLITPIVFEAHKKSLAEISHEVKGLATRAREGKLAPQEYQGGTFTISNLGMYGVSDMVAIINPPQGAILGIGAAHDVPVVKDGQVVPGKVMSMTISCDHRVIDGAEAANFMRTLKKLLENPILFLSE